MKEGMWTAAHQRMIETAERDPGVLQAISREAPSARDVVTRVLDALGIDALPDEAWPEDLHRYRIRAAEVES